MSVSLKTWLLLALIALTAVVFFSMPPLGLDSNDSSVKYLQMKSFVLNRWSSLEIPYPAISLDPELKFIPGRYNSLIQKNANNRFYCVYGPLFTFISSLVYLFLGDRTIFFLPLLSFLVFMIFLYKTLKIITNNDRVSLLLAGIAGFASPLSYHAIIFMEHLPAVALMTAGLYLIILGYNEARPYARLFWGVFLISFSIFLRIEMGLILFAVVAGLVLRAFIEDKKDSLAAVFAGAFIPAAAFLAFNYWAYGNFAGMQVAVQNPRVGIIYPSQWYYVVLELAVFWLFAVSYKTNNSKLFGFTVLLFIAFLLPYITRGYKVNVFKDFPFILISFYALKFDDRSKFGVDKLAVLTIILYLSLFYLFRNSYSMEQDRFFIVIVPLCMIVVGKYFKEITGDKIFIKVLILLAAVSLVISVSKTNATLMYCYYNQHRIDFLKKVTSKGDIVAFQFTPTAEHLFVLYYERLFMEAHDGRGLEDLVVLLKGKGVNEFYWVNDDWLLDKSAEDRLGLKVSVEEQPGVLRIYKISILNQNK